MQFIEKERNETNNLSQKKTQLKATLGKRDKEYTLNTPNLGLNLPRIYHVMCCRFSSSIGSNKAQNLSRSPSRQPANAKSSDITHPFYQLDRSSLVTRHIYLTTANAHHFRDERELGRRIDYDAMLSLHNKPLNYAVMIIQLKRGPQPRDLNRKTRDEDTESKFG